MLTPQHQAEAEKKLKLLADEQETEKTIKSKVKNVSKTLNEKLKTLIDSDPKTAIELLSKLNEDYVRVFQWKLSKFLGSLESGNQGLIRSQEKLKNQKDILNRQKINALDDKERYNRSINQIKETIIKIQKAIEESVKEQSEKRRKIEDDLDKSIAEIKEKIETFQKQSVELQAENKTLKEKKEELLSKLTGLEDEFKNKASEKDELIKKDKEGLMQNLKEVENQVNEATQLNKKFAAIEKSNFDNKLQIYLKTKKFPQLGNSMENSANTIQQCKKELTKGVHRLQKAKEITRKCDEDSKVLNEQCLDKIKKQNQAQQKLAGIKKQKEQIRSRILELQSEKKKRQSPPAQ